jgi:uncharacterized protein with GYD domain
MNANIRTALDTGPSKQQMRGHLNGRPWHIEARRCCGASGYLPDESRSASQNGLLRWSRQNCLTFNKKGSHHMPRYLVQASYTSDAIAAFVSKPQDRVAGIRAVAKKMGGKLESCDYSLGDDDLVAIATFPDDTSAAAMSLAVNAPGHLKKFKTTRLMSAKEFLEAQKKAHGASYKAPTKA